MKAGILFSRDCSGNSLQIIIQGFVATSPCGPFVVSVCTVLVYFSLASGDQRIIGTLGCSFQ